MTKIIEFFFDFASPYAYLASTQIQSLASKYGYQLVYRPIDLFAAKQAAGNTGPATVQMPIKFRYIAQDLRRWAQRYGVPFLTPLDKKPGDAPSGAPQKKLELTKSLVDSSRAHKGMFFAHERGQEHEYFNCVFKATYGSGGIIGDEETLTNIVRDMGWPKDAFFEFVDSDVAVKLYEAANKDAQIRGIFGVPTIIVDDQMWWGNDRLHMVEEYLAAHPA